MSVERNPNFLHASLQDLLNFHGDNLFLAFNCHQLGTIVNFYPSNQTADVTIDYLKVNYDYNQQTGLFSFYTSEYPPVTKAPVIFQMGQKGGTTIPVVAGDRCLVLFNDRDMDAWYKGIKMQKPASGRLHAFNDALILPLTNPATPVQNFDTSRPMLRDGAGQAYVAVNPGNSKIQVKNPDQNLATILQSLISHIQGITIISGAVSPASQALLATDAANLGALLE
ncbi:MAG TPA: Gp138 family membrane-puncturing spike protein [Candidatus Sulfotelmatobacter sp.]|nr:Gp138 family membrane-puncturing spike protein [Candidatus Sulfotelmatobacter sp.]